MFVSPATSPGVACRDQLAVRRGNPSRGISVEPDDRDNRLGGGVSARDGLDECSGLAVHRTDRASRPRASQPSVAGRGRVDDKPFT